MSKRPTSSDISKDFLAALQRLRLGQPNNPQLQRDLANGRLRINVSSVALEAGRSRTLLSISGGKHLHVRQLMQEAKDDRKPAKKARCFSETISTMRRELADFKRQLHEQKSQTLAHFHARRSAERNADKWRRAYDNIRDDSTRSGNVVPFKRKDNRGPTPAAPATK